MRHRRLQVTESPPQPQAQQQVQQQGAARPIIYTFYASIEGDNKGTGMSDAADQQLLQAWTDSESSLGNDRLLSILEAVEKASELGKEVAFLVGPEGGWSSEEEAWFDAYSKSHLEKVMGVSLGSNVLRAETASILAIGAVALWSSSK